MTPVPRPDDCCLYRPGHRVHWIQATRAGRDPEHRPEPGRLVSVGADGSVVIEVDGDRRRLWNHDPAGLEQAAAAAGGVVLHQSRWGLLLAPSGTGSRRCFCVVAADADRAACTAAVPGETLVDRLLTAGGGTLSVDEVRAAVAEPGTGHPGTDGPNR